LREIFPFLFVNDEGSAEYRTCFPLQEAITYVRGWSYEFPVEVEDSRHYTLEPFSKLDVFEHPNNIFFEGPSRLINDETGETVGVAVNESMDVRIMQNAPYGANQY
jgi:hypothetical protein